MAGDEKIQLRPPQTDTLGFYIPMKSYSVEDGLVSGNIVSSFCDKEGKLWFGSASGGVSSFDGKSFVSYGRKNGLVDDQVFSIFEDRAGSFWFGKTKNRYWNASHSGDTPHVARPPRR